MAKRRYQLCFALLLVFFLPVLAVTSDIIIVVPLLALNPIADPLKIFLMGVISLLVALNGSVILHNYDLHARSAKKTTFLGALGAFFTTACPVCQPIWLVWLGFGSASLFLVGISTYIEALSVGLLGMSLYYSLESVSGKCNVKMR